MGLFDKVKKILFDEDEVEIPINGEELPEREAKPKKEKVVTKTSRSTGFIDYGTKDEEEFDDAPIKEVIVPKEEEKPVVKEPEREFHIPDLNEFDEIPKRSHEEVVHEEPVKKEVSQRRDYASIIHSDVKVKKNEERDYHKLIENTPVNKGSNLFNEKKPFTVTPVISPVFGIIGETKAATDELISVPKREEVDPSRPRMFGPVSYNDSPLPTKTTRKEEIKSVGHSIDELMAQSRKEEVSPVVEEKTYEIPVIEEEVEDDMVLQTPNYDDMEEIATSGVEKEYLGNNNIEDAFESTTELEQINYDDSNVVNDEDEEEVKTDDIIEEIKNEKETEDEDAHLDDTIETDLFNLIDSMYKSDDEDEVE